jgi:hypothetical protein
VRFSLPTLIGRSASAHDLDLMPRKALIWIGMTVGSAVGGYLPALWGGDFISFSGLFLSTVGGFVGIWLGYRYGE